MRRLLWLLLLIATVAPAQTFPSPGPGRRSGLPPESFGMQFNDSHLADAWPTQHIGSVRLWDTGTNWYQIETSRGTFTWAHLDAWLDKFEAAGTSDILYCFGKVPDWAHGGTVAKAQPPSDVDSGNAQFGELVDALLAHNLTRQQAGHSYITRWELWNEPYNSGSWTGTAAQLFNITSVGSSKIRAAATANHLNYIVHSPPLTSIAASKTMWDAYMTAGGASLFDVISWHYYEASGEYPEIVLDRVNTGTNGIKNQLTTAGLQNRPLFLTETNSGLGNTVIPTTDAEKAQWVVRTYLTCLSLHARCYWYAWDTQVALQGTTGANAFGTMQGWITGHQLAVPVAVDGSSNYSVTYISPQRKVLILWRQSGTSAYSVPNEYLSYQDVQGTKSTVSGHSVTIGPSPLAVMTAP
jgi:hypothetical protein